MQNALNAAQAAYTQAKAYLTNAPDVRKLRAEADALDAQAAEMNRGSGPTISNSAYSQYVSLRKQADSLRCEADKHERKINQAKEVVTEADLLNNSQAHLETAKQQWQDASEAHVHAIKAVRTASDALDRLQGLIANEAAELAKAKGEQRSGILAQFGLGGEAKEPLQSVADVQARIEAFESVLPEHEQALAQAKQNALRTDAAVKEAEGQILTAKAYAAAQEEAKAFEVFKAAHLRYLATGVAAKRREQGVKLAAGYWSTRLYGDRHHIDHFVPTVPEMTQDLINQAEKGE